MVVSIHPTVEGTSLTCVTVMPPHPSAAVTPVISGAGTAALQPGTAIGAGQDMVGGVISTVLVMVWTHEAVRPLTSVAI